MKNQQSYVELDVRKDIKLKREPFKKMMDAVISKTNTFDIVYSNGFFYLSLICP